MRVYCVTGVHRSGTSLVARVVNLLGAEIGPEDQLLPPAEDNPRGFWENEDIKLLNDRVLSLLGGSWSEPPMLGPGWEHAGILEEVREEARRLVVDTFGDAELVAWKDPRCSLLLPFWESVVRIDGTLLVLRDPAEVATSLAFRNGFSPEHSAHLWLRYVVAAWLGSGNRLVVQYDDFFDDLPKTVAAMAWFLEVGEPTGEQQQQIEEAFDPGLRRYRVRPSPIGPNLELAYAVHELVTSDTTRNVRRVLTALTGGWLAEAAVRDEEQRVRAALEKLAAVEQEVNGLRAQVVEAKAQVVEARRSMREADRRYGTLRQSGSVRLALRASTLVAPVRHLAKRGRERVGSKHTDATGLGRKKSKEPLPAPPDLDVDAQVATLQRLSTRPPITVVVPVFNAFDELERCVASLERNTSARDAEILFVDDASTDARIGPLLDDLERWGNVRVLRNESNLGFTRTVNRALGESTGDVVLLNSDAVVTPRWLQNLADAAYCDPRAATVTALSDNAGAFSVPQIGVANDCPPNLSDDEVGRLLTRESARLYPQGPTGNGFCMYVKRAAIDQVGAFDDERFPRGYGEEGDFCMRAREAGWVNVVDDATIVFHSRSASFGADRDELMKEGRARLDERHPDYTRLVREFVTSERLTAVQRNVRAAYDAATTLDSRVMPRVLFVHHRGTGGTIETNADLMRGLVGQYEPFVLTSDTRALELSRVGPDGPQLLERRPLSRRLEPDEFTNSEYRATVADILRRYAVDLVHVRLLLAHTLDLAAVAHVMDIPVILSFHDFFLVCPTVHLLDEQDRFCGGVCTAGDGECRIPSDWVRTVPHLKHSWVRVWQEHVSEMLRHVDAFVTTSPAARDIYVRTYPELADAPFHLIEHGRDLEHDPVPPPIDLSKVRIVVPGTLDVHKGARLIEQIIEQDHAGRLELHFIGKVPPEWRHLGVMHGPYEREHFATKMREIRPAFVAILSIWAETYSHTLSEAWASGIPVLVTDLGAPKERVERHGGGWIIDHTDPRKAYQQIRAICDDEPGYRAVRAGVGVSAIRHASDMVGDYDRLYRTALLNRRSLTPPESGESQRLRHAGLFVAGGSEGPYTGSVHVRSLRRFHHPIVRQEIDAHLMDVADFVDDLVERPDVAVVQRTAVPANLIDDFLAAIDRRSIPLVVDVDDDLFAIEPDTASYDEYQAHLSSLDRLLRAADLVTVSTEPLAAAMAPRARRVEVVRNVLDEQLWFGGEAPPRPAGGPCRLLYMGTKTHSDDLAMLRPALERLRRDYGLDVSLSVIGGEEPGTSRWYERIGVPAGTSHYPAFVPWFRTVAATHDIGVAPLTDTAFNASKSDLKFLEYAAAGLPGVYSAVPAYESTVRDGDLGLLADETEDAWVAALAKLATDAELRERLVDAARRHVLAERCMRRQAPHYLRLLRELSS